MAALVVPTQFRQLSIDKNVVPRDIMADIASIEWNDETNGQDTLTVTINNKYQKYFARKVFQRGMPIMFTGGMSTGKVYDLFSGTISRINVASEEIQTIVLHCTTLDTQKMIYRQTSSQVYKRITPVDVINVLCGLVGVDVTLDANSATVEQSKNIVTNWYPEGYESVIQRAQRICNEILGANAAVKYIDGHVVLHITDKPRSSSSSKIAPLTEVTWGKDLQSYSFGEESEDHPPESIKLEHVPVSTEASIAYRQHFDELEKEIKEEDLPTFRAYKEKALQALSETMPSGDKAITEAKLASTALQSGSHEITGSLILAGKDVIFAGHWIKVSGIGPYSGTYYITKGTHTWSGEGYGQTLELGSRQKSEESEESEVLEHVSASPDTGSSYREDPDGDY